MGAIHACGKCLLNTHTVEKLVTINRLGDHQAWPIGNVVLRDFYSTLSIFRSGDVRFPLCAMQ
jgi:hypothetical protein